MTISGLVDFDVDQWRKGEQAAAGGIALNLLGELQDALLFGGGGQNELHRKLPAARQGRRQHRKNPNGRNALQLLLHLGQDLVNGALALAPGLHHHPGKSRTRIGHLKGKLRFRHAHVGVVDRGGVAAGLIQRGVGGRIQNAEHDPLVLGGGQFLGRHNEHRHRQQPHHDPHQVDGRTRTQSKVEHAGV